MIKTVVIVTLDKTDGAATKPTDPLDSIKTHCPECGCDGRALYNTIARGVRLADMGPKLDDRIVCVITADRPDIATPAVTKQQVKDIISGAEAMDQDWIYVYTREHMEGWSDGYCEGMSRNSVPFVSPDGNTRRTNSALKRLIDTKRFALPKHRNVLSGKLIYIL